MVHVLQSLAALLQVAFVIGAALWGYYLYLEGRRGELRVGIDAKSRLVLNWRPELSLLIITIRMTNTSGVLYRHREMTVTLMDARGISSSGSVRLVPFRQADPFPAVYGDVVDDPELIEQGKTFELESSTITLEPNEHVDSEVAFILDSSRLGLMAVRILTMGYKGRLEEHRAKVIVWGRKAFRAIRLIRELEPEPAWWGSFFYVDPNELENRDQETTGQELGYANET